MTVRHSKWFLGITLKWLQPKNDTGERLMAAKFLSLLELWSLVVVGMPALIDFFHPLLRKISSCGFWPPPMPNSIYLMKYIVEVGKTSGVVTNPQELWRLKDRYNWRQMKVPCVRPGLLFRVISPDPNPTQQPSGRQIWDVGWTRFRRLLLLDSRVILIPQMRMMRGEMYHIFLKSHE